MHGTSQDDGYSNTPLFQHAFYTPDELLENSEQFEFSNDATFIKSNIFDGEVYNRYTTLHHNNAPLDLTILPFTLYEKPNECVQLWNILHMNRDTSKCFPKCLVPKCDVQEVIPQILMHWDANADDPENSHRTGMFKAELCPTKPQNDLDYNLHAHSRSVSPDILQVFASSIPEAYLQSSISDLRHSPPTDFILQNSYTYYCHSQVQVPGLEVSPIRKLPATNTDLPMDTNSHTHIEQSYIAYDHLYDDEPVDQIPALLVLDSCKTSGLRHVEAHYTSRGFIQLLTPTGDKVIAFIDNGAFMSIITKNGLERIPFFRSLKLHPVPDIPFVNTGNGKVKCHGWLMFFSI